MVVTSITLTWRFIETKVREEEKIRVPAMRASTWISVARHQQRPVPERQQLARVSDEFMRACGVGRRLACVRGQLAEVIDTVDARKLFRKIGRAPTPGSIRRHHHDWHEPGDRTDHRVESCSEYMSLDNSHLHLHP